MGRALLATRGGNAQSSISSLSTVSERRSAFPARGFAFAFAFAIRDFRSLRHWADSNKNGGGMSIAAAWPFAATGASISAVNITVEPAPSDLTFGAAPSTAKGVLCEHIGGASYAWCG